VKSKTKTWIVIADGAHARVFSREGRQSKLDLVAQLESPDARAHSSELGADRPGRVAESATTTRHAVEPRTDLHREEKRRFAGEIAALLAAADVERRFDKLVLVAPARTLNDLFDQLEARLQARIEAKIDLDLTWVPTANLLDHLRSALDQ
jgi:protein required for attachment to host cells